MSLFLHGSGEPRIVGGIVHVGKHEILPDQDPQLVAAVVEGVRFVHHRAADADHVHPRDSCLPQRGPILGGLGAESREIERGPARAAAEHRNSVQAEREPLTVAAALDLDRAETDSAERKLHRAAIDPEGQMGRIERLRAVGVGPPPLHARNSDLAARLEPPVGKRGQAERSARAADVQLRVLQHASLRDLQEETGLNHSSVALDRGIQRGPEHP